MTTRSSSQKDLDYMLVNVLRLPSDGALALALSRNGFYDILDVMNMENDDINIIDTGDPAKPMMLGTRVCLRVFKAFLHHLGPNVDFRTIASEDFQEF